MNQKNFQCIFVSAGEKPLRVHSFRQTRVLKVEEVSNDKMNVALMQEMGHSSIITTRWSYGALRPTEQRKEIMKIKIED